LELKQANSILIFNKLRRSDLWVTLGVILLNFLILIIIFGDMLLRINKVGFASGGDGLKSYYAALWHIRTDEHAHWFTGLNYPYGEHIFYADARPPIVNTIRWFSHHVYDISDFTIGILNSQLLLSIVLASVFLLLIFRKAGVHWAVALLGATAIAWLTPQLWRMPGHFSLSYGCHIPGVILFLMLYAEKPGYLRSLLVAGWVMLIALTHFYFFAIAGILLLLFWLHVFIRVPSSSMGYMTKTAQLLLQLVLPILLVQFYIMITDPVTDRPNIPFGFMFYRAYPESVFFPLEKPYFHWMCGIVKTSYIDWEGWAYAGAVVTFFFLGTFFYLVVRAIQRRFSRVVSPFNNPFTGILFWAGTLALLWSFAVPFVFGLQKLILYIGPLKQMRALGRFAWLFFYTLNIVAVIEIWRWYAAKRKIFPLVVMILVMVVLVADGLNNTRGLKTRIDNPLTLEQISKGYKVDPASYQAIVPLPYFHVGSEIIWWDDKAGLLPMILRLSLYNQLPTTGQFLSRTSVSQTLSQIEPFLPNNPNPEVFAHYNNKKLLLITSVTWPYNILEKRLIDTSTTLFKDDQYCLGEITMEAYKAIVCGSSKAISVPEGFIPQKPVMIPTVRKYAKVLITDIPDQTDSMMLRMKIPDFWKEIVPRTGLQIFFNDGKEVTITDRWELLSNFLISTSQGEGFLLVRSQVPPGAKTLGIFMINTDSPKRNLQINDLGIKWISSEKGD
jgi:hypothetical protein